MRRARTRFVGCRGEGVGDSGVRPVGAVPPGAAARLAVRARGVLAGGVVAVNRQVQMALVIVVSNAVWLTAAWALANLVHTR